MLAGNADVTFLIIQEYSTGSTNHITDNTFLGNKLRILEYKICRHVTVQREFPVRIRDSQRNLLAVERLHMQAKSESPGPDNRNSRNNHKRETRDLQKFYCRFGVLQSSS